MPYYLVISEQKSAALRTLTLISSGAKHSPLWCEALSSDAEGRASLREDPGRGLGFGSFHSNSALLFNDVLTAGGKSGYTIAIDE